MGTIYLIGAGPGNPHLLTVRAAEVLARAGVVVHDAGVGEAVLARCGEECRRVQVGGAGGLAEEGVVPELLDRAREHPVVARLVTGDPFLSGSGTAEALALAAAGVAWELVPGVGMGTAGPAYAGIPLTTPGVSGGVTVLPGLDAGGDGPQHETPTPPRKGTLVVHVEPPRVREHCERLLRAGLPGETPAALIREPTGVRQYTVGGTLSTLPELEGSGAGGGSALLVVGEPVALRPHLAWYESRPLFGRRVVVTRPRAQARRFVEMLEDLGAEVVQMPTIRVSAASDPEPLLRAAARSDTFDWIVFTSVNGVDRFWQALRAGGLDTRWLAGVSLCAIGPATAAAIELEGARADLVPEEYVAEAVVEALAAETELQGSRILLPRADIARPLLPRQLEARGAEVTEVAAYRTEPDRHAAAMMRRLLEAGEIDLVTFTASSTVRSFVDQVGTELGGAQVASIGPITSGTARELGLEVAVEAETYTIPGLVAAVQGFYRERAP